MDSTIFDAERFMSYVSPEPMSGCWLWTGRVSNGGYGVFRQSRKEFAAHRVAYTLYKGALPRYNINTRSLVCHTCDVRSCVNPDHLYLGTHADNTRDMLVRGRHPAAMNRDEVTLARVMKKMGASYAEIANTLHYSEDTIKAAVRGVSHTHNADLIHTPTEHLPKLSDTLVRVMRERYAQGGITLYDLCADFGVSVAVVHNALTGRSWKNAGGPLHKPRFDPRTG